MNEELEQVLKNNLKDETLSWQNKIDELRNVYEKEIKRRVNDYKNSIDILAKWVLKIKEFNSTNVIDKKKFSLFSVE